ncbi:unnamed protein product [Paramecium pentaurelia]|uniref:Uncharacterized protein n=1 Tax=Paramecium pentaurelia TaxID=43138 RepID=A0A8S1X4L4_9CILI|nr:unnamed protein product [Paramecium pentaurelia]
MKDGSKKTYLWSALIMLISFLEILEFLDKDRINNNLTKLFRVEIMEKIIQKRGTVLLKVLKTDENIYWKN